VYDGPPIADEANPTIIAEPENLAFLLDLVADRGCPSRRYLLGSLYCMVGHSDRSDPRLETGVAAAQQMTDPWLTTWASRVRQVMYQPESFNRADWCGWPGYADRPEG
jgi:hypothetical protein